MTGESSNRNEDTDDRVGLSAPLEERKLASFLFPSTPRAFPGQRGFKMLARSLHVLCAGVLVGAHVLETTAAVRLTWLSHTALTGVLILGLDFYQSAAFLFQVRGAVVMAKLLLLLWLLGSELPRPWTLALVLMVSVLSSHAPARFRYFLLVGRGRIHADESKG